MRRDASWIGSLALLLAFFLGSGLSAQTTPKSRGGVHPFCVSGCITYGVSVTPTSGNLGYVSKNQTGLTLEFTVKNTGSGSDTYALSCSAIAPFTCTDIRNSLGTSITSVSLGPNISAAITVVYSTGHLGGSGYVYLVADDGHDTGYGQGSYSGTVADPGAPSASLINSNPAEVARDLCFTSGAGEQAGLACGDLFVTHGMPAYRTMGRDRALSLEYNSATTGGLLLVPIQVTEASTIQPPNSVKVVAKVGSARDSATFNAIPSGTQQQVVLGRGLGSLATGVYAESLTVTNQYSASSYSTTTTGQVLVVNRSSSPYGKGWGLDGVEQLIPGQTGGNILWIDGDGSARLYGKIDSTTWVAPAAAFRDTISLSGGLYTRYLRHGVKVVFDTLGRHIRTYNRLGDTTSFAYTTVAGQSRLTTITVPPNDAKSRQYHFYYNSSTAALDSIRDPGGRRLKSVMTSGKLTSLTDPDGQVTSYEYSGTTSMMTRQVFARPAVSGGTAGTVYVYANNSRVTQVKIPAGATGTDTTRITMTPWDERGLASGAGATGQSGYNVTSSAASTLVDGPITGVGDQAQVWVNQFGAPTKTILTGTGATTTIVYGDTTHPALATQVTSPTSVISKMHYNARGNLDTLWQSSPDSSNGLPNRRQTWAYDDGGTPDGPTTIKDPRGRTTTYAYTSLGLADSVIDSRGHHTDFGYVASGSLKGMVDSVNERSVPTWWQSDSTHRDTTHIQDLLTLFTYDTNGNALTARGSNGGFTTSQADSLGRVTNTWNQYNQYIQYTYDVMNRVTVQRRDLLYMVSNPFVPNDTIACDHAQFHCHDDTTTWGTLGLPDSILTHYYYTDGMLDSLTDPRDVVRGYRYDARDNRWKDVDDYGNAAITYSGGSGLVDSTKSRSAVVVKFTYDSIGRRTRTVYPSRTWAARDSVAGYTTPGDSIKATYDAYGRVTQQQTSLGTMWYGYFADGSLNSKITNYPFSDTLQYRYDSTGARTYLYHSTVNSNVARDSTKYFFGASTGDLDSLAVWWIAPSRGRKAVAFKWDALGRRSQVTYPNGQVVKLAYDAAGGLRHLHSTGVVSPPNGNSLNVEATNDVADLMGRILHSNVACTGPTTGSAYACGTTTALPTTNLYNQLNAIGIQISGVKRDTLQYDASGSITYRSSTDNGANSYVYPAKHDRDSTISHPNGGGTVVTTITYTADGDRLTEEAAGPVQVNHAASRYYFYDGLGRMSGLADYIWGITEFDLIQNPNQCKYAPDGKMVYSCGDGASVAYDGDNVVATDWNPWHFVQGPGVDDPLMGVSLATSGGAVMEIYYITDGQGRQYAVADSTGVFNTDLDGVSGWKGWKQAGPIQNASSFNAARAGNADSPQLSFFRNRIYDQRSGQWTQEDPAGVAGGDNLYQYVGNDPVRFTDPFGLCPDGCVVEAGVGLIIGAAALGAAVIAVAHGQSGKAAAAATAKSVVGGVKAAVGMSAKFTVAAVGALTAYSLSSAGRLKAKIKFIIGVLGGTIPHSAGNPILRAPQPSEQMPDIRSDPKDAPPPDAPTAGGGGGGQ